jgi:hypothetical protein
MSSKVNLKWFKALKSKERKTFIEDTMWIETFQHVASNGTLFTIKAGNKDYSLQGITDEEKKGPQSEQLTMRKYS